jgi:PAS domain S-box-containing protein
MWILDRGAAFWAEDGTPLRMAGSESDISERKRAEKALRQSEARFAAFMAHLPGVAFMKNAAGQHVYVNEGFERLFGMSSKDWYLKTNEELFPPEVADSLTKNDQALMRQGHPLEAIETIVDANETRSWLVKKFLVTFEPNSPPLLGGIAIDITERKETEEALRESEERYRTLVELLPSGVFVFCEGKTVYVNQMSATILGATAPGQILERPTFDFIHPDFHDEVRKNVHRMLTGGVVVHRAERLYLKLDGTSVPVQVEAARIAWNGRPAILGIFSDITERKKAEEALYHTSSMLAALIQSAPVAIITSDTEGHLSGWNPAAERMFGWTESEVLGRQVPYIPPEKRQEAEMLWGLALAGGTTQGLELQRCRKDGSQVEIEFWGGALRDRDGTVTGAFGVMADITERKQTEDRLRTTQYAVDHATDYIFVIGSNGYFLDVNESACRRLGYTKEELLTKSVMDIDPDFSRVVWKDFWEEFKQSKLLRFETRHRSKSGTIYPVEVVANYILHEGQELDYAFVRDISERKQAEEALAQSERQLRTVLDALPVGVWFTDQAGKPLLANPAAKKIWSNVNRVGLHTAENPSGWWEPLGSSGEPHRWALSRALTNGESALNETLDLECLNGTRKTIRNTTVPVQDEAGVVLGALVLNEDITALRHAQEALKLTQFSVDHAVEGFFWISPDAKILHVNDAACRMLEYTCDELTAMTVHDIDPNFPPERWSAHWEELKQKGSMTFESRHWSKTGRVLETEVTVNYLQYDGRGYNCAIMRDIGDRKRAEDALRASEELFAKAFRASPNPVGITEADTGRCLDVNDACLELFGFRREEVVGHTTLVLGIWPNQEDRAKLIERLKIGGPVRNLEMSFRVRSGELRHILVSSDLVAKNCLRRPFDPVPIRSCCRNWRQAA